MNDTYTPSDTPTLTISTLSDDTQDDVNENKPLIDSLDNSSNNTIHPATPPSVIGEQSISGDMPDPESDDDMLLASQQVGLRLNEDEDNPQPLNIAQDVADAERWHQEHDED